MQIIKNPGELFTYIQDNPIIIFNLMGKGPSEVLQKIVKRVCMLLYLLRAFLFG
jgi:hypothetical protein